MVMASHTESVHIPTEKKVSFLRMYLSAFLWVPNQSQIICHIPKKKKKRYIFLEGYRFSRICALHQWTIYLGCWQHGSYTKVHDSRLSESIWIHDGMKPILDQPPIPKTGRWGGSWRIPAPHHLQQDAFFFVFQKLAAKERKSRGKMVIQGGAPPVMWTLVYNPNNYRYNPHSSTLVK